ncbi:uncharacterized protein LOC142219554 [Haematobia irritans]|uniref:uncharacterized protein LOC142219554 n=1 Tax=Haematobia irritans TaxID=7368 RepID=UPI003F506B8D
MISLYRLIFILLSPTFVINIHLEMSEKISLKLCCNSEKFYNIKSQQCELLPQNEVVTWNKLTQLPNNLIKTINPLTDIEYTIQAPCEYPSKIENVDYDFLRIKHILGDYCFTHQRPEGRGQYTLYPLNMRCEGKGVHPQLIFYITGSVVIELIILLMICIYITIKELRDNILSKLFISNGISIVAAEVLLIPVVYDFFYPQQTDIQAGIIKNLAIGFGASCIFWALAICYDLRRSSMQTFMDRNINKSFNLYLWYSLYILGFSILMATITSIFSLKQFYHVLLIPILVINTILFLVLTFDIFRIRLRTLNVTKKENQSIWKHVRIILRLSALMSLSQITYYTTFLVNISISSSTMTTIIVLKLIAILNTILIFGLFIMRREVRRIVLGRVRCNVGDYKDYSDYLDKEGLFEEPL